MSPAAKIVLTRPVEVAPAARWMAKIPAMVNGTLSVRSRRNTPREIQSCRRQKYQAIDRIAKQPSGGTRARRNRRPSGGRLREHLPPQVAIDDRPLVQRLETRFDLAAIADDDDVEAVRVDVA